jgi:ABC-type methionine transport system permease subunit
MILCQTLEEARAVPGVVVIVAANPIRAYVVGDVIPVEAAIDQAAIAADTVRENAIDSNIAATSVGAIQPATITQLQAMTVAQYSAWFDANFTTAAQAIGLLKRLTLIVIRRLL